MFERTLNTFSDKAKQKSIETESFDSTYHFFFSLKEETCFNAVSPCIVRTVVCNRPFWDTTKDKLTKPKNTNFNTHYFAFFH